jgi:hypothetical protein
MTRIERMLTDPSPCTIRRRAASVRSIIEIVVRLFYGRLSIVLEGVVENRLNIIDKGKGASQLTDEDSPKRAAWVSI